jgi:hypothetical protein
VRRLTEKQKIDYVDVVIAIPKAVMDFLEANKKSLEYTSVEAYINLGVLQMVKGDIEAGEFGEPIKMLIDGILKEN